MPIEYCLAWAGNPEAYIAAGFHKKDEEIAILKDRIALLESMITHTTPML